MCYKTGSSSVPNCRPHEGCRIVGEIVSGVQNPRPSRKRAENSFRVEVVVKPQSGSFHPKQSVRTVHQIEQQEHLSTHHVAGSRIGILRSRHESHQFRLCKRTISPPESNVYTNHATSVSQSVDQLKRDNVQDARAANRLDQLSGPGSSRPQARACILTMRLRFPAAPGFTRSFAPPR